MSKLVVLSLLGGDLNQGFPVVTAQFWHGNQSSQITASLPAAPELNNLYQRWQSLYEAIHQRLGNKQRIRIHQGDVTNISVSDFDHICQQLRVHINGWLKFESFQNLERRLRTLLNYDDEIRIIIQTDIVVLHRLPWQLWDFFEDYPNAELALSNDEYASPRVLRKSSTGRVKILAILGNRVGIDIDKDSDLLKNLKQAQTTFLVEPTRKELDQQLWNHDWDILFFAGHSATLPDGDIGEIYINQTESLTISQLRHALKTAISRGLSVAIFNSCDGIGLARNLADLNISQMIVMRTGVPDSVAQEFLKYFLIAFADGKPLYLAVREARERLHGLENEFPCASWLPVIYQNPTTAPITWEQLHDCFNDRNSRDEVFSQNKISLPKSKFVTVLLGTLIVPISIIGLRYSGALEVVELSVAKQILQLKPKNNNLVVIEFTEKYIKRIRDENEQLKNIDIKKSLEKVKNTVCKPEHKESVFCKIQESQFKRLQNRFLNTKNQANNEYLEQFSAIFKNLKPGRNNGYQAGLTFSGSKILSNLPSSYAERVEFEDLLTKNFSLKDKVILLRVTVNSSGENITKQIDDTILVEHKYNIRVPMLSQIVSEDFAQRPILQLWPLWGDIIWICGCSVVGSTVFWRIRSLKYRGITIVATIVVLYGISAIALLNRGLVIPFVPSAFGLVAGSAVVLFFEKIN